MSGETEIYDYEYADDEGEEDMPLRRAVDLRVVLEGDGKCYFPNCPRVLLVEVEGETIFDGQAAHIETTKDGPRHNSTLTPKEYEAYENVIHCCFPHHQIIDVLQVDKYSKDDVREMKRNKIEEVKKLRRLPEELLILEDKISISKVSGEMELSQSQVLEEMATSQSQFTVLGGHKSPEEKQQWVVLEEFSKKRIEDWLYFQTVWYKDVFRGEFQFYDWRTTEDIERILHIGALRVRNLCELIETIERDMSDQSVEKWRIKESHHNDYEVDGIFEQDYFKKQEKGKK